jgi:mono/diheme cytochrome c family protein
VNPTAWRPFAAAAVSVAAAVATPFAWRDPPTRVETREAAVAGDAAAGRQLFEIKGCAACHEGPDVGDDSGLPDLSDAASWAGERRPGYSASEYLTESMRRPGAFRSPAVADTTFDEMPNLGLSEEEIAALVAYLLEP